MKMPWDSRTAASQPDGATYPAWLEDLRNKHATETSAKHEAERSRLAAEQTATDAEAERTSKELAIKYERAIEAVTRTHAAWSTASAAKGDAERAVAGHGLASESRRRMVKAQLRELADPRIAAFEDELDTLLAEMLRTEPIQDVDTRLARYENGKEFHKPIRIRSSAPAFTRRIDAIRAAQQRARALSETADIDVAKAIAALRKTIPAMPGIDDLETTFAEKKQNA